MRLERAASAEDVRDEWRALAALSGNVFAAYEWMDAWRRHLGRGEIAVFRARRDDGSTAAILPLHVWRTAPLRVVRFAGHGPADQLGPVCAEADLAGAAALLPAALEAVGADVFVGEQLPGGVGLAERLGGRTLSLAPSPVLRLGGAGWEELLRSWSPNLRGQVRRKERKLFHEHDARFRLGGPDDLDVLFRLHRDRWAGDGSAFAPDEAFQREFAAVAFANGWARLWLLEADGAPRAAWYGFRFGGADSYYQAGRDRSWDGSSVGFVLLAHTIRAAAEDRRDEYRFLRGGEAFKYRFASHDPGLVTVGLARGRLAGASLSAALLARRAARRLRGRGDPRPGGPRRAP